MDYIIKIDLEELGFFRNSRLHIYYVSYQTVGWGFDRRCEKVFLEMRLSDNVEQKPLSTKNRQFLTAIIFANLSLVGLFIVYYSQLILKEIMYIR